MNNYAPTHVTPLPFRPFQSVCFEAVSATRFQLIFSKAGASEPLIIAVPIWLTDHLKDWAKEDSQQAPFFPNIHQADNWREPELKNWRMNREGEKVDLFTSDTEKMTPDQWFCSIPLANLRAAVAKLPTRLEFYAPDD